MQHLIIPWNRIEIRPWNILLSSLTSLSSLLLPRFVCVIPGCGFEWHQVRQSNCSWLPSSGGILFSSFAEKERRRSSDLAELMRKQRKIGSFVWWNRHPRVSCQSIWWPRSIHSVLLCNSPLILRNDQFYRIGCAHAIHFSLIFYAVDVWQFPFCIVLRRGWNCEKRRKTYTFWIHVGCMGLELLGRAKNARDRPHFETAVRRQINVSEETMNRCVCRLCCLSVNRIIIIFTFLHDLGQNAILYNFIFIIYSIFSWFGCLPSSPFSEFNAIINGSRITSRISIRHCRHSLTPTPIYIFTNIIAKLVLCLPFARWDFVVTTGQVMGMVRVHCVQQISCALHNHKFCTTKKKNCDKNAFPNECWRSVRSIRYVVVYVRCVDWLGIHKSKAQRVCVCSEVRWIWFMLNLRKYFVAGQ